MKCSICGNKCNCESENCFGLRCVCKDCNTFIWIRYNPAIYTYDEAKNRLDKILEKMKSEDKFKVDKNAEM